MSAYLNAIGIYAGAVFVVAITARKIRQWRWHKYLREHPAQAKIQFKDHEMSRRELTH